MLKYILVFSFLFSLNLYAKKEVLLICGEAKSQLIDLEIDKIPSYNKDKLSTIILVDKEAQKFYLQGEPDVELIYVGEDGGVIQFLEPVASGHKVLITFHIKPSILTTQKSYSIFGSVMVSIIQKCEKIL